MFSLELPHQCDSNEYIQYTFFQNKKENQPKLSQICSYGIFSKGLNHGFQTAVVNEPSVFESLNFYCISLLFLVSCLIFQVKLELNSFLFN